MRIAIQNTQTTFRLNRRKIRDLLRFLMRQVAASDATRAWREISVVITDDAGISPVNMRWLRHAGPTDVISFAYDSMPGEQGFMTAELVVNAERADCVGRRSIAAHSPRKENRRGSRKWSPSHELALYLAHGCDHLLPGEDDSSPLGRRRMRRRELRWLREAESLGLLSGLLLSNHPPRAHPKSWGTVRIPAGTAGSKCGFLHGYGARRPRRVETSEVSG